MKKLKKMQLKLDKEVITSLSNLELVNLKGGEGNIPPADSVGCPATKEGNSCNLAVSCIVACWESIPCSKETCNCTKGCTTDCPPIATGGPYSCLCVG